MPPFDSIDPYLPLETQLQVEWVAPNFQGGLGSGAVALRRTWVRPLRRFVVETNALTRTQREALEGFFHVHQGDSIFNFTGHHYGTITTAIPVGIGDGSTVDFFLPAKNITPASVTVYVDDVETGVTVTEASGLITFAGAPGDGTAITATYSNIFRVFCENSNELLAELPLQTVERYGVRLRLREVANG